MTFPTCPCSTVILVVIKIGIWWNKQLQKQFSLLKISTITYFEAFLLFLTKSDVIFCFDKILYGMKSKLFLQCLKSPWAIIDKKKKLSLRVLMFSLCLLCYLYFCCLHDRLWIYFLAANVSYFFVSKSSCR